MKIFFAAAVALYGIASAIFPEQALKHKYYGDPVPPTARRAARIVGIIMAVGGIVALLVMTLGK